MKRILLAIAFLAAIVYIVHHPIMAVPAILLGGLVLLYLLASSVLGAARLLRYGGRRARRNWRAGQ